MENKAIRLANQLMSVWTEEELRLFAFDRLVNELEECTSGEFSAYEASYLRRVEALTEEIMER